MSQSNTVAAFRKRLYLRGFSNISIIRHGIFYHISFDSPISGCRVEYGVTENRLENAFKFRRR